MEKDDLIVNRDWIVRLTRENKRKDEGFDC